MALGPFSRHSLSVLFTRPSTFTESQCILNGILSSLLTHKSRVPCEMNTMIFSLRSRSGGAGALRGLAKNRRLRCNSFRWLSVDPIKTAPGGTASPGSLDPDAPPSLRVCFLGTDEVSVETLRVLLESCKGSGAHPGLVSHLEIVCPGDRPSGRGQLSLPVPVKSFAISNKLPFYEIPWGRCVVLL